ncbi:MAG: tRNA uridine-5-carboxymethylaminomethyl(34) synthesis GTPase MnmE [Bernardetiaceae bacterium]|nr:tRNA uridine-5-carboxymethylaminomethyl(34) synthesis GTPase MnmE [Bernardetiaceae bacterium]
MWSDTIMARATAQGQAALAILRLSGIGAISSVNQFFSRDISDAPSHTVHIGFLHDAQEVIDEVVITIFRAPRSFTREDVVEISCHGSNYVVERIIKLFLDKTEVRYAKAGEFTQRAFLNGRIDLAQAEAIADLIASESEAAHRVALQQMRGGFSQKLKNLREQLLNFTSLIELELDFGEEDVEFANREELRVLVERIQLQISSLLESFALGNAIKNGVSTVIAGKPNAGKSTLLNAILEEEKAIVSDIAGTTRDTIEDEIILGGTSFRFIDTAGLRQTDDRIEAIGVLRARKKMQEAALILYLIDLAEAQDKTAIKEELADLNPLGIPYIAVGNKVDAASDELRQWFENQPHSLCISALAGEGLEALKSEILRRTSLDKLDQNDTIVTNARHYESLKKAEQALDAVLEALELGVSGDLLSLDIRQALEHIGDITGQVSNDEVLGNIFGKFCIGK